MAGGTIQEQAPGLADSLIEALSDRDESVRQTIVTSLVDMGRHKLDVILKSGHSFLIKHPKLSRAHRILILQMLETVCKEHIDKVSSQLAVDLISLASRELTASSDVVPEWQTAASSLLTTLGLRYADKVLAELMVKFPPGGHPHYFVVRSLGLLAVANAKAVVPSLNTVIARMLPMLSQAKHDNMQWVFSSTIAMFCESILEYLADKELAARTRISAEGFEGAVYSAYEHLYSQWLTSKESKLRVVVVGALGYAAKLLSPEHLDEQLPKLVPSILQLYRKHSEQYILSQSMCSILEAATQKNTPCLQGLLDTILMSLHTFACVPLDPSSSVSIRNQSELLRCFTVLTEGFSDRVISFLLSKLEGEKEKVRLPTLYIIKHVINSCGDKLADKRPLIVNGLKILLLETNLKVRSVFAQVVISMAGHHYLSVEGGRQMIEFVLKQCAMDVSKDTGKSSGSSEAVTPRQLRDMNDHVLRMISTTIPHMDEVLWPFLLEFVKSVEYTEAFGILTRCIAHIGGKKRESGDEDYLISFEEQVNVPRREDLIARLFVMAGHPSNGRGRGEYVLQCFQVLGPNLVPPSQSEEYDEEDNPVVKLWDTSIPKMLAYLNEHKDKEVWNQKQWEDLVLKLLAKTLDVVGEEDWVVEVGRCFGGQVPLYEGYPEEKSFAYKCLGMVMLKSSHKDFIQEHLNLTFSTVNHTSQEEREGCAYGFGFCASSHLDQVMVKLEQVTREELTKKSKGFFSFGRDKSDADLERIKSTVMLCYGYVTYHSPPHLITARVEVNIWRNINPHFAKVKDTLVKQNLIRSMDLIGRSLHVNHLKKTFVFSKRVDLINHLLAYIREEAPNAAITTETRALSMDALATLVKLEPRLTEAEQFDIIKTSLDHTLAVPPLVAPSEKKGRDPAFQQAMLHSTKLTEGALTSANNLLVSILLREVSSRNLQSIFKHLEPWLASSDGMERERSSALLQDLLEAYQKQYDSSEDSDGLDILGHLLGRLVPRATDPQLAVRQSAIHCIQVSLRVGTCEKGKPDKMVDALSVLKQRATADDPTALFTLVSDLGKVLCKKVADRDLWDLACALMDGLLDYQAHSSNGACVVLNSLLKQRGPAMQDRLSELLDSLHDKLGSVTNPQTKTGTLRCVRTLGVLFTVPTITHLLNKPLNYEPVHVTAEMWATLGADQHLVTSIFNHMLETLTLGQPYQEKAKGNSGDVIRVDTPLPRAITAALIILFKVEEAKGPLSELYAKFLPTLLARIGNSLDLQPVDPKAKERTSLSLAVEAFREFLDNTGSELIAEALDSQSGWALFESFATFPQAVMIVANALGVHYRQSMLKVVEVLSSSLSSVYENQRLMVVSFYSQLICTLAAGDVDLAEQLMNFLLGRQVDVSYEVRMICIRGLGNMAEIKGSQVSKFSTTILSALMAGMDDRDDPEDLITMEAMSGLAKVFEKIEESCVRPILINISLRIRPCFEKPLPSVRAAAFKLFGSLARFSDGPSRSPFLEQVQTNFVSLLLHLNEEDPTVIEACKVALKRLGPLLSSARINQLFQDNLNETSTLLYGEFLNSFCKLMVVDFTDRINFYVMDAVSFFRNLSPFLRGNASLFVGFALGHLPEERIPIISKEHICDALILLLKDPEEKVRCCVAEAISMLHRY